MYPVSAAYMTAIGKPVKTRRIRGTVGTIAFTDANLVTNTLKIDNRCSEGTELTIGSVYIGQLTCVFKGINLTGAWMGKVITIAEELLIDPDEDTWESVPLGVFHVVEALHQDNGIYVVAYDAMDYLDKPFALDLVSGTPYDYLTMIAEICPVTFAQTEEQVRALPNGDYAFALYSENDITTCRDLLSWVAQTMACIATATRDGKIELRTYGGEAVDEIGSGTRWEGSSFSDYVTRYTGVSVVNIDKQETIYKGAEVDDALTYNLGSNPLLQNMQLDEVLGNILEALGEIAYTPFNVDRSGCPAYDLCDVLTFPDGIGGNRTGCIMAYEYDYHDVFMIDGYGSNPALMGAQSKEEKEIAGLMSRTNANQIQYYTFTNGNRITVDNHNTEIMRIRFGSMKDTTAVFHAEIKLDADTEETVKGTVTYIYNENEMTYHPVETWIDGNHLLHLLYYYQIDAAEINTLRVLMRTEGGTVTIERADIQAAISGQGLAASDKWDGWIDVEDAILVASFRVCGQTVDAFAEDVDVDLVDVITLEIGDDIADVILDTTPKPTAFDGSVYINKQPLHTLTWGDVLNLGTWQNVKDDYGW